VTVAHVAVFVLGAWLAAGCGGSSTTGSDGGSDHDASVDASSDTSSDTAADQGGPNPCAPGTCRFHSDPSAACLPPGGPSGPADGGLSGCCACGNDGFCSSECLCASPDTPIATPSGDRPIATLSAGDLVFSVDHGRRVAVPIRETRRTPVANHRVVEVVLRGGATLRISAAHPTADGRIFGELREGDWLGGFEVTAARMVPYAYDATYDILPDSDTGTYFAGGALIGSTLTRHPQRPPGPPSPVAHPRPIDAQSKQTRAPSTHAVRTDPLQTSMPGS
jgi:hypothetical protein